MIARECAKNLLQEGDISYRRRKEFEANVDTVSKSQIHGQIAVMLLRSDEVALLSSLTLIYRTIESQAINDATETRTTFGHDCIFIARKAMDLHLEMYQVDGFKSMLAATHAHWYVASNSAISPYPILILLSVESD
jgi:hypothetical protein